MERVEREEQPGRWTQPVDPPSSRDPRMVGWPKTADNPRAAGTSACRVFLVDDHPLVREWVGILINQFEDLTVCGEASCSSEALARISELKPDVAIVDLSLQEGSGFDVIRNIGIHSPHTGIVVLSMHEEMTYAERALRAGARAYVMKVESTATIVAAIRKVMTGGVFLSPSMKIENPGRFVNGAHAPAPSPAEMLSNREMEVFLMLGRTHGTRQIAQALNISIKTVQSFCERIKEKLGVTNASQLLREAVRWVDSQEPRKA